jgi:hypothetical protein
MVNNCFNKTKLIMHEKFNMMTVNTKNLKNSKTFKAELHGFHIVEPSP